MVGMGLVLWGCNFCNRISQEDGGFCLPERLAQAVEVSGGVGEGPRESPL